MLGHISDKDAHTLFTHVDTQLHTLTFTHIHSHSHIFTHTPYIHLAKFAASVVVVLIHIVSYKSVNI